MIRLRQQGARNAQTFRLVVMAKESPRDGKYIEKVGFYNPLSKNEEVLVEAERIDHWLEKGAVLSEKAEALVRRKAPEVMKKFDDRKKAKIDKKRAKRKAAAKKNAAS
jgi:small subunit ribosomal protein S16